MPVLSGPEHLAAAFPADWLRPDLGAAARAHVGACMTARSIGSTWSHSVQPYAGFNLGTHVGDEPGAVAANRSQLEAAVGQPALWLNQVHGNTVVHATPELARSGALVDADGSYATQAGVICTVMVADCLPVLLAAPDGRGVAALHAGWRGLAGAGDMGGRGILESGVHTLCEAASCDPADLSAWLGPCIGPTAFEVGADVLEGFGPGAAACFTPQARTGADGQPRWLADLPALARARLAHLGLGLGLGLGLAQIHGGQWCTVGDASRFFSFRRDRVTGRQAACIWLR
ncbi:MAG: peptidoglycan editing factor PgeF [Burkholderiales bacterium]|nr:peptidoglycan editing factor PgeF [Burkholderiales bacterium]